MTHPFFLKVGLFMGALTLLTLLLLPASPLLAATTPAFVVNYNPTYGCKTTGLPDLLPISATTTIAWTPAVTAAFQHALNIWTMLLNNPTQTIVINACLMDLGPPSGFIGMAQPVSAYANFEGAPLIDTLYAAALANRLTGIDQNDTDGPDHDGDGADADAEIIMVINGNSAVNWYYGLDGRPAANQYDFVTTVLHETAHGLGLVGTLYVGAALCDADNVGCWGGKTDGSLFQGMPAVYDKFVVNGSNQSLINTAIFSNQSLALAQALTNQNVFFHSAHVQSATLYAPNPFEPSSSILHLNESTYNGTPNQLMTPIVNIGVAQHHPGPLVLGMFKDMGWPIADLPPVTLTKSASTNLAQAGQVLTYTLLVTNTGPVSLTRLVITDVVPAYTTLITPLLHGGEAAYSGIIPGSLITWTTSLTLTTGDVLSRVLAVRVNFDLTGVAVITNTAGVTSTAGLGAMDSVTTPVQIADLQLSHTVTPTGPVNPGGTITYTLTFTNAGPYQAMGVVITDELPITLTQVTSTTSGAVITPVGGSNYHWTVADLLKDEGGIITLTGKISAAFTVGGRFTNTASIAGLVTDDNSANNSSEAGVMINESGTVYLPLIIREN